MAATSAPAGEYLVAPNREVSAANGIDYTYREVGEGTPALVLLQHFRGNLDNWDPELVDALARDLRVVTFDNAGVGASTGTTPGSIAQTARDAIAFLEALELGAVDLLGFSIGSFVAQEIALIRPTVVRRLVLASAAPRGAAGMHGWAPEVIGPWASPRPTRRYRPRPGARACAASRGASPDRARCARSDARPQTPDEHRARSVPADTSSDVPPREVSSREDRSSWLRGLRETRPGSLQGYVAGQPVHPRRVVVRNLPAGSPFRGRSEHRRSLGSWRRWPWREGRLRRGRFAPIAPGRGPWSRPGTRARRRRRSWAFGGNRGGNELGANRVSAWLLLSARVLLGISCCAGNSR
jgi:pimeloyl-ACP methyl ester carboxylesterase